MTGPPCPACGKPMDEPSMVCSSGVHPIHPERPAYEKRLFRIIEDTLLLAADQNSPSDEASALIDLAARLYVLGGFDPRKIPAYVWVPSGMDDAFISAVERRTREAQS